MGYRHLSSRNEKKLKQGQVRPLSSPRLLSQRKETKTVVILDSPVLTVRRNEKKLKPRPRLASC